MPKTISHLALCGAERSIKARLREEAQSWLDEIKEKKNQLRAKYPKDWRAVPEYVKVEFIKLMGAEHFIIKFFNLSELSRVPKKCLERGFEL